MLNEYGEETTRIAGDQEIGALPITRIDGEDAPTSHGTFAAKAQGEAFDRAASLAAMQRADEENEEAFSGMPTDEIRKRLEYSRLEARARLMVASQDRFQDEEFGAIFRELNKRRFIADDRTLAAFDVIDGDGKPTNLSRLRDFLAFSDRLSSAKDADEAKGLLEEKFISPELKAWREATALDAPNGIANDGRFGTTMWMDPNGNPVGTDNRARIAREYFARNGRSWGDKIAGLREAVGNPNDWIEGTTGEYFSDRRAIKEYEKVIAADILRVEAAKVMPFLTDAQRNLVNLAAADADMEQFRGIFKAMKKEDRELMYSMCQAVRPSWDGNWFSEMVVRGATGVRSAFRSGSRAVRSLTSAVFDDEKERKALADGMIDDIHWAESVSDLKLKDPESFVRKALEGYADSASLQYSMLGGALLKRAGASLPGWQGKALAGAGYLGEGYAALSMIGEQFDNMLLHGIDLNRAAPLAVCGGLVDTWIERWNIETWMGAGLKPAEMKRVGIRAAFRAALKMDGAEFARVLRTNAKQAITIAATETAEEMVQGWNQEGWLGLAEGRNAMDAFVSSEAVTGGMDALWEALPSCTAFGVFGAANPTGSVAGSANDAYREHLLTVSSAVAKRKGIDNLAKACEEIAIRLAENEAVRIVRATSGMTAKERNAWINAQDDLSLAEKQFYVEHCEMYAASVAQDGKEWADAHLSGSIDEAMFAKAGWKFGHDRDGNITSIVSKDGREWKVRAENRTATIDDLTDRQVRNLVDEFNALVDDKELDGEEKFEQINGKSDIAKWSEDEVKRLNSVVGRIGGWYNKDGITLFLGIADEGTLSHELTHSFVEKLESVNNRTTRRHLRGLAALLGSNYNERTAIKVEESAREDAMRQKEETAPERVSLAGFGGNAVEVLKRVITLGMKRGEWSKMFKGGDGGNGIDPKSHFAVVLGSAAEALERRRRMEEKQAKERKAISDRFKAEREAKRQAKIAARKGEADAANAELSAEESAAIDEQEKAALAEMEARHEQERRDMETLERVISPDESGATRERNGTVKKFIESQGGDAGKFPLLSLWSERGAIFNKPFDKTDPLWDDYRHMEMSKSIQRLVFGWGAKAERGKGNDGVAAEIAATHPQFAGMSEHELLEAFLAEYGKYKEWKRNGAKTDDEIASEEEFNKLLSELSPDEARQLLEAQSRMADVDTMLDNGMISWRDADEMKIDILADKSLADVFRRAGFGNIADEFHTDFAIARKYGIGSSAVNGDGFVDLAPGDTFGAVEQYVQSIVDAKVSNDSLGIKATIGSKRNAEHLAQKMSQFGDEVEEAHKYAVKNILPLFAKSNLGIVQHDKKGGPNDYIRAFTPFSFGGAQYAATITLRRENGGDKIYTVEAVEIENAEGSPRSSRRTAQGAQPSVSLRDRIAYYVGDVNATNPSFIGKDADTPFSVDALESRVREELEYFNDGTRTHFSLKSPVERTKDLVALHNMSEDAVKPTADLGGFAIPSIAIFKNTYGHNEFGEVSVLFGKETIDPRKNRLNRVYSHDAWTATFPAISNKIDQQAIERKNEELIATLDERLTQPLYNAIYYLRNDDGVRDSWDRATDAGDAYGRNDALKAAYLVSRGEKVEPVYKDKTYIRGGHQRVYMLHEDGLRSLYESPVGRKLIDIYLGPGAESVEQYEAIAPQVAQIFRDIIWKREHAGKPDVEGYTQDQVIGHYFTGDNQLNYGELYAIAEALTRLDEDVKGDKVGVQEIDEYKTRDAISGRVADNDPGFVAWLNEQYGNPILGKGVYNGADRFTRMGNRRSWDALHDPATLENIVRAMKKTQKENGNGIFGSNPFGVAARTLRSMQDIFATENILKELTREEEKAIKEELSSRLSDIVGRYGKTQKSPDENPFTAADRAADMMFDAYQKYGQSIAGLKRELNGWGYSADDQLVKDFADLMAAIEMMPTNYFEAKPQRPVRFDEPKAWIVPHDAKPETLKTLRGNGQRIYTYRRGDNADRLRVVNEAANDTDALFSIRNPGGAQKRSDLAYPDATPEISNIPDGLFSIGKRKREEFKNLIVRKRPDFKDPDRAVEEIGKFATPKEQKAALKWLIGGRLILPEDAPKVTEAIRYAEKAKKDPLQYDGPVELMNALAEFKPKDKPIDPDTVPQLSDKRVLPDGVVTYAVQDDRAGQQAMREIVNTHWGKNANPWCLLHGDGEGNLSDGSDGGYNAWEYWNHYNALPKRVAFRNGKLLAFMATETPFENIYGDSYLKDHFSRSSSYPEWIKDYYEHETWYNGFEDYMWKNHLEEMRGEGFSVPEKWWDRNDEDHPGIPLGNQAVPNDPLGRYADFIIDKDGKRQVEGGYHKNDENVEIYWNENGVIDSYRDKKTDFRVRFKNGNVKSVTFREGSEFNEFFTLTAVFSGNGTDSIDTINMGGTVTFEEDGSFSYHTNFSSDYTFLNFKPDGTLDTTAENSWTEVWDANFEKKVDIETAAKRIAKAVANAVEETKAAYREALAIRDRYTTNDRFSITPLTRDNVLKHHLARDIVENGGRMPDLRRVVGLARRYGYKGEIASLLASAEEKANEQTRVLRYIASNPKVEKALAKVGLDLEYEQAIARGRSAAIQYSREVSEAAEGTRRATERAVRQMRGEDYEMMIAREGLDLNAILLAIRPPDRKNPERGEGGGGSKPVNLTEEERKAIRESAMKAVENGAALIKEARAKIAAKKDDGEPDEPEDGRKDKGSGGDPEDIAYGNAISAAFHKAIADAGLTLESPEAMVQLVKAITEKYVRDFPSEFGDVDLGDIWSSPLVRAKFAANLASFAQSVSDAYAPSYARVRIARKTQLLQDKGLVSVEKIEEVGEEVFRDLHKDVIRQTRDGIIKEIKKILKPHALHYKENELKQDRTGVSSALGMRCKFAYKAIKMSPKEVEDRSAELVQKLASWSGVSEDEAIRYREFFAAKTELEMLDMFGNLNGRMPAELVEIRDFVEQSVNESRWETMQFGEKWEEARVKGADAMCGAIVGNPKKNGVMPDDDEAGGLYSLIGMMEVKARQLTRWCADAVRRDSSLKSFSMVEEMIQRAYDIQFNYMQMEKAKFVDLCKSVYGGESETAQALHADIDPSLWSKLDRGGQKTKWTVGRLLQMYVSCVQSDYAENCAKYGRDAEYVRFLEETINSLNPKHMDFVNGLRGMYLEQGDALSEVLERTTGTRLLTPNRLYMPVQMNREHNLAATTRVRAYLPFARSLTPRVKNGLDFDQGADILDIWHERLEDAAHTIAWADTGSMVQGICQSDRVLRAIRQAHGKKVMGKWNNYILDILAGAKRPNEGDGWGVGAMRFCSRLAARTWLMLNPASWAKQLAAIPCYALSQDGNLGDVVKSLAFCALHPKRAAMVMKDLSETSAFRARYGVAISQEMKYATSSDGKFKTWIDKMVDLGMSGTTRFDSFGVYALALVYHNRRSALESQGMSAQEASETAASWLMHIVDKTAQTTRTVNTTELQRAGGVWGILLQFKSAPAQQTQFELGAIQEALAVPTDAKRWKKAAACVLINHLIVPTFNTAIESVLSCLTSWGIPDEEKRDRLIELWIANIISGSLGSIFFLGTVIEGAGCIVGKVATGNKVNTYDLRNSLGRQILAAEMLNLWVNHGDKAIKAFAELTDGDIQEGAYEMAKALLSLVPGTSWVARKGFKAYESATEK